MSPSMKLILILFACLTQALSAGGRDLRSDLDSDEYKFADECDLSNSTSAIDPNEVFMCGSGYEVSVAMLCDAQTDCTDMEDEYGCVDCINRFNEDGYYTNDSRICIQNQSYCKCVQVDCYENNKEKYYKSYSTRNSLRDEIIDISLVIFALFFVVIAVVGICILFKCVSYKCCIDLCSKKGKKDKTCCEAHSMLI